jgi:hypothetical protein
LVLLPSTVLPLTALSLLGGLGTGVLNGTYENPAIQSCTFNARTRQTESCASEIGKDIQGFAIEIDTKAKDRLYLTDE